MSFYYKILSLFKKKENKIERELDEKNLLPDFIFICPVCGQKTKKLIYYFKNGVCSYNCYSPFGKRKIFRNDLDFFANRVAKGITKEYNAPRRRFNFDN